MERVLILIRVRLLPSLHEYLGSMPDTYYPGMAHPPADNSR
jgi:hypothetical protein